EINLVSMFVATQAVATAMVDAGSGGSIVNAATIEACRGGPMFAVFAPCKAGMVSFTRTMALELSEHRIRVNCIAPDHTVTPGLRGNRTGPVDPGTWADPPGEWSRGGPLGREGLVEEGASTVVGLCSKRSEDV